MADDLNRFFADIGTNREADPCRRLVRRRDVEVRDDKHYTKRQPTIVYCWSPSWLRLKRGWDPGATGFRSGCSAELPDGKMGLGSQDSRRQGNLGVEGKRHGI